ncbi:LysR family transcriptional regulator (plasmid) [Bradyrhizobium sp. 62B]|nr:LysR family transcriptional regulator [Bradyrhizobium sp. 62B]
MDLRQLRYFVFVADLKSIARASAHLGVAGPAISRSISALEDELRTPLFDRDGRGMQMTEAGLMLHRSASQILRDVELVRQEVMAEGKHLTGDVIIGATPSVIAMAGAELIRACRERLPRVRPRLLEGYSAYLQNWVLTGSIDVALVNGLQPDSPRLVSECLAVERLFAIGPPGMFAGDPVGLASLLEHALLLPSAQNPIRSLLDTGAAGLNLSVSTVLEIDSVTLLKDLVRQGLAPAVLPFGAVKYELETGVLSASPIVSPEIRSDLDLIYLADRPPTRVASEVIDMLLEILRQIVSEKEPNGFVEIRHRANARRKAKT